MSKFWAFDSLWPKAEILFRVTELVRVARSYLADEDKHLAVMHMLEITKSYNMLSKRMAPSKVSV